MSGAGRGGDPADGCDDERLARAHLSRVAEPGDRGLPRESGPQGWGELVDQLRRGEGPEVWQARHGRLEVATADLVASAARAGLDLLVPGDECWPSALDDLHELPPRDGPDGGAPVCLWVRGQLPPAQDAPAAAALVGARACSAYGEHVAQDLGAGLVDRGWTVVSGAAYGIDGAAHRGALAVDAPAGTPTVAVLAGGVDRASPAGHDLLLQQVVAGGGAVVSEHPPGTRPAPYRFLLRNRLIAAWARGTVVVEASLRSGALNTARTAADLSRQVAAVPGPVTSATSAGTNRLLRDGAVCVSDADDVVELLGAMGSPAHAPRGCPSGDPSGSATSPLWQDEPPPARAQASVERLGPDATRVWSALPTRGGVTTETLVVTVGLPHRAVAVALAALELEGLGLVERVGQGWRRGALRGRR